MTNPHDSGQNKQRTYKVRGGFTMHRKDSVHHAGETVKLTAEEAAQHAHQIEPLEDSVAEYVGPRISPDQRKRAK